MRFPLRDLRMQRLVAGVCSLVFLLSCSDNGRLPLKVELGARTISKLPLVIAADQGLYEKYGLDIDLRLPAPTVDGAIETHDTGLSAALWQRLTAQDEWKPDIYVDGVTPGIVKRLNRAGFPRRVAIGGIDCIARAHIVAQHGIQSIEELRGKRIGISARRDTTTGFVALILAQKMGWDPDLDISIMFDGRDVEDLEDGNVDAIVASETRYAVAIRKGYPVLLDTLEWNMALGGNSPMIEEGWLDDPVNRESAKRFLRAMVEALVIFHSDRDLAIDVMQRWYGIEDYDVAATMYERGGALSKVGYPCYEGIENTMELYDSNAMRQHEASDFYDDSLMKELEAEGFIDDVRRSVDQRAGRSGM